MSFQAEVLNVLIASPGDVAKQRDEIETAIYEWNSMYAETLKVILLPKRWEKDVAPGYGNNNPQGVINEQIVFKSDIVIGVFWHRMGSPTTTHQSGTLEELDHFKQTGKDVMLYFVDPKDIPEDIDFKQAAQVEECRKKYASEGIYSLYKNGSEVQNHLYKKVVTYIANREKNSAIAEPKSIAESLGDEIQNATMNSEADPQASAKDASSLYQKRTNLQYLFHSVGGCNYSNNNGIITLGTPVGRLEMKWSKASDTAIHAYEIYGVSKIGFNEQNPYEFEDEINEDDFNFTSDSRTVRVGEVFLLRYINGVRMLVQIKSIEDRHRGGTTDKVEFKFKMFN